MKIKRFLENPYRLFSVLAKRGWFGWLSDEQYIKLQFRARMGKKLDLKNPKTYSEKLQWLKLYDRRPAYTAMVDKYEVKKLVAEQIGEEYIIPTLGIWSSFAEIDFDLLPEQFVLKCTHDSGGLVICKDKSKFDKQAAREMLEKCLKRKYYAISKEWPYKHVEPRIIGEQYVEDSRCKELRDYKFFCFGGEAKALFIATDRQTPGVETKFDFFDMEYNHLPFLNGHPNAEVLPEKPERFDLMRELAEKLSAGIPHVRVDFYEVDGRVYFGEMTFFHWSGLMPFEPESWDYEFGSWIQLPEPCEEAYAKKL